MISVGIDRIDERLRARQIIPPSKNPDFTFTINNKIVNVWVNVKERIDVTELEDLVWITMTTIGAKW